MTQICQNEGVYCGVIVKCLKVPMGVTRNFVQYFLSLRKDHLNSQSNFFGTIFITLTYITTMCQITLQYWVSMRLLFMLHKTLVNTKQYRRVHS